METAQLAFGAYSLSLKLTDARPKGIYVEKQRLPYVMTLLIAYELSSRGTLYGLYTDSIRARSMHRYVYEIFSLVSSHLLFPLREL